MADSPCAMQLEFANAWLSVELNAARTCLFVGLHGVCPASQQLYLPQPLPRSEGRQPPYCLLQDDLADTCAVPDTLAWLASELLPALCRSGARRWLWVSAPTTRGYQLAEQLAGSLPQFPFLQFHDTAQATAWLHQHLAGPAAGFWSEPPALGQ